MIDVEHGSLRAFEHHRLALGQSPGSTAAPCRRRMARSSRRLAHTRYTSCPASSGSELNSACAIMFFSRHRVLDVLLQQLQVEQVDDAQSAASHLVLVGRTDPARGGADLHSSGSIFRRQFDHAVVRKITCARFETNKLPSTWTPASRKPPTPSETRSDRALHHCR